MSGECGSLILQMLDKASPYFGKDLVKSQEKNGYNIQIPNSITSVEPALVGDLRITRGGGNAALNSHQVNG